MTNRTIKKILIANRGEIALRVIRACKEMGIRSVAVFSEADRNSLHVLFADEAYPLGGSAPQQSYLNQQRILEIASLASVDAVHPGYGFLAENPVFSDAVHDAGLIFVGPSGNAIRLLGDKTEARKTARRLGVPTISGTLDPLRNAREGQQRAGEIGYPVLLKAAAGGGGKGMRVVRSADEFERSFTMAQSEAKGAFGDERVYIEKYLDSPRHIEMQILADDQGNVIYLGERECSVQRRHQKVIEESPSTVVTADLRKRLGEAAVRLAKSSGYVNAGTLEFLLDTAGNFYFLEVNTRLQVEHPVTEEVTGLDIVKMQIQIAQGDPLPISQEQVQLKGHAIECRICAEDPTNAFMPSTGKLTRYRPPQGRIRVESGFREGDTIPVFYDSLMAKVISWGATRQEATSRMLRALDEFQIEGVESTIPFCRFVLRHRAFIEGQINTSFVDREFTPDTLQTFEDENELAAVIAATLIRVRESGVNTTGPFPSGGAGSRWRTSRREVLR